MDTYIKQQESIFKQSNGVFTGDWHIRETSPICRIDNYWETMWKKINFITNLAKKHRCWIYHGGDVFDKSKSSPYLLAMAIKNISKMFYIPGQHDLPNNNINLLNKSNLAVLEEADIDVGIFKPLNLQIGINNFLSAGEDNIMERKIAIIHTLVHKTEEPVKIMGGVSAKSLMKKLSKYDVILTSDNHQSFVVKHGNQILINPGSLMRMSADQIDHRPCVYLYYAKDNHVEPIYLPIEQGVIDRSYIDRKKDIDTKIEAFVSHLKDDYEVGLSFRKNLKLYFDKHRTKRAVEKTVWGTLE